MSNQTTIKKWNLLFLFGFLTYGCALVQVQNEEFHPRFLDLHIATQDELLSKDYEIKRRTDYNYLQMTIADTLFGYTFSSSAHNDFPLGQFWIVTLPLEIEQEDVVSFLLRNELTPAGSCSDLSDHYTGQVVLQHSSSRVLYTSYMTEDERNKYLSIHYEFPLNPLARN